MEMYIVLAITLFMMVMFIWNKVPFGVTTMTCCLLLAMFGIVDIPKAFGGFGNKIVVLIAPMLVLTIYCLFAWKLMPKEEGINQDALKKTSTEKQLTDAQEMIVYGVFVVVMLLMLLNKYTGNMLYLAPAAGVLVLIYTKVVSVPEAVKGLTADMTWMLAGVLIVADALGSTGAGDMIGNAILSILGENPSSVTVMFVFSFATVIMTTFLSNMATQSVLIPIAASVALAAGWDPRGLVLIIGTCNYYALGFPSGSGEAAVCFAAGGYNPLKVMKFTFPYMIIAAISTAVSAQLLFPLY